MPSFKQFALEKPVFFALLKEFQNLPNDDSKVEYIKMLASKNLFAIIYILYIPQNFCNFGELVQISRDFKAYCELPQLADFWMEIINKHLIKDFHELPTLTPFQSMCGSCFCIWAIKEKENRGMRKFDDDGRALLVEGIKHHSFESLHTLAFDIVADYLDKYTTLTHEARIRYRRDLDKICQDTIIWHGSVAGYALKAELEILIIGRLSEFNRQYFDHDIGQEINDGYLRARMFLNTCRVAAKDDIMLVPFKNAYHQGSEFLSNMLAQLKLKASNVPTELPYYFAPKTDFVIDELEAQISDFKSLVLLKIDGGAQKLGSFLCGQ